jgi:hypothetical protein
VVVRRRKRRRRRVVVVVVVGILVKQRSERLVVEDLGILADHFRFSEEVPRQLRAEGSSVGDSAV